MAKGAEGGGNSHDDMMFVAVFVVVLLGVWLVWAKFRHIIVYVLFSMDWLQYAVLDKLHLLNQGGYYHFKWAENYLTSAHVPIVDANGNRGEFFYNPHTIDGTVILDMQRDIGRRVRWFMAGSLAAMSVYVVFKMKGDGFTRVYSLSGQEESRVFYFAGIKINSRLLQKIIRLFTIVPPLRSLLVRERTEWVGKGVSFMHYQAQHWKVALAGAHFRPDDADEAQAPALTPPEWLRDNGIRLSRREGLDEEAVEKAFARQLGPAWQGIERAPTHVQALCLMAAFNFRHDKRMNDVRDRLTELYILNGAGSGEQQVAEYLKPLLADRKLMDSINRRCAKHAFTNTAVIGLVGFCGPFQEWDGGTAGVFAPAMYRWLKRIDRVLWYGLQNIGRRAYHIEGAGAISHFFAERVVGGPLAEGHIDSAIEGLLSYIDDHGISDLEDVFRAAKDF